MGGPGSGIVIGFEADAMYMDTDKSINLTTNNGTASFRSGLDFLGTARGRLGYAFNQFLVYGTGGFAYGDVNSRVIGVLNGSTSVANASGFNTGYTYGGGVEYALPTGSFLNFFHSSAVTVKAEYSATSSTAPICATPTSIRSTCRPASRSRTRGILPASA